MLKLSENNSQGFLIPESFKLRVCNLSLQMCYVNGFSEQKLVTLARHTGLIPQISLKRKNDG